MSYKGLKEFDYVDYIDEGTFGTIEVCSKLKLLILRSRVMHSWMVEVQSTIEYKWILPVEIPKRTGNCSENYKHERGSKL